MTVEEHTNLCSLAFQNNLDAARSILKRNPQAWRMQTTGYQTPDIKVDIEHPYNAVPLNIAVLAQNISFVRLLMSHGASIEERDSLGRNAVQCCISIPFGQNPQLLKELLESVSPRERLSGFLNEIQPGPWNRGQTLLGTCAFLGHTIKAKMLVEFGADVGRKDGNGNIPQIHATKMGRTDLVELFTKMQTDNTISNIASLYSAIKCGDIQGFTAALGKPGVSVNFVDGASGLSPLLYALRQRPLTKESVRFVRKLVSAGAQVGYVNPKSQKSVLHYLLKDPVEGSKGKTIQVLDVSLRHVLLDTMVILLENGCAVNVQDDTMSTPIHYACKLGDHKIITLLLQCQEIDAARRNAKGKTPLDECILLSARKLMLDYFAQLQVPLLVSCPLSSLPEDDVKKVLEAKVAKLETQAAQMRDQTQKLQVNLEQSANSLREAERERDHLKQETLRLMEIAENPLAPPAIFHANEIKETDNIHRTENCFEINQELHFVVANCTINVLATLEELGLITESEVLQRAATEELLVQLLLERTTVDTSLVSNHLFSLLFGKEKIETVLAWMRVQGGVFLDVPGSAEMNASTVRVSETLLALLFKHFSASKKLDKILRNQLTAKVLELQQQTVAQKSEALEQLEAAHKDWIRGRMEEVELIKACSVAVYGAVNHDGILKTLCTITGSSGSTQVPSGSCEEHEGDEGNVPSLLRLYACQSLQKLLCGLQDTALQVGMISPRISKDVVKNGTPKERLEALENLKHLCEYLKVYGAHQEYTTASDAYHEQLYEWLDEIKTAKSTPDRYVSRVRSDDRVKAQRRQGLVISLASSGDETLEMI